MQFDFTKIKTEKSRENVFDFTKNIPPRAEPPAPASEAGEQAEWIERRPWYMKAADIILPGAQFRTPPPEVPSDSPSLVQAAKNAAKQFLAGALEGTVKLWQPAAERALQFQERQLQLPAGSLTAPVLSEKPWEEVAPPPETTGQKVARFAGEMVPELIGITATYGTAGVPAAARLIPQAATGPLATLGRHFIPGAVSGALWEGGKAALEGQPLPEVGKEAALGAAMWGAGDVAFSALGKAASLAWQKVRPAATISELLGKAAPEATEEAISAFRRSSLAGPAPVGEAKRFRLISKEIPKPGLAEVKEKTSTATIEAMTKSAKKPALNENVFYRGTVPGSTEKIKTGNEFWDSLLFLADNIESARPYGPYIEKYIALPGAKILREGTAEFAKVAGRQRKNESLFDFAVRAVQRAKEAGYDAVWFKRQSDLGTAVINRDMFKRIGPVKTVEGIEAMAAKASPAQPSPAIRTGLETVTGRKVMIDRLMKALDIPARVGRIPIRKAIGVYKVKPEVIRTKLAEDMPTIAHEVGHHLDKIFGIRKTVIKDRAMRDELIALGQTQPAKHFTEGIAEFIRYYLTGDEAALKQAAPRFFDWFESTVKQEPKVWDALQQFRQDYKDYMAASAKARVKAAISVGERQTRKVTLDRIMQAAVDDLRPIDTFVEKVTGGGAARKALKPSEDPFVQAWLFRGWTRKAQNAIWYGVRDKNMKKVAPGLAEILEPVADKIDDFRAYIVSKRAIELHGRGIETGIDINDAVATVKELDSPVFRKVHEDLKKFQDAILDRLVESGLISAEQKAVMRQLNQEYVPFYRVFDPNAGGVGFGKRGFADLAPPIKRLKGSGRTIVDPLESIIRNTYYLINLAERNNVGRTLVDLANKFEGMGKFVEKVDPKKYGISFKLEEIARYLEQVGVELPEDALKEVATIFRPSMVGSPKENILVVWRNGKPELYQLHEDLYRAVLMLDQESMNTLVKILSYPASWLRAGAVLNPEFVVRNIMRDAFGAWVYSKYGFVPLIDTVRGIFHVIKKDELYQLWLEGGGAGATLVSLDRAYLQEDLRKLITKEIWPKMKMYARHPLEILRVLSEFSEEATRLGEFAKGVQTELKRGLPLREAVQKAALASRDITLDFSRAGTVGRPANRLIAFFNASVQGIDKMRRAFKEDPVGATFKSLTSITLPSIALWAINHDNPKYQQLPQWRKDLFWNIIVGDYIVSIPKPFELGVIFGSLPERILDWAFSVDPESVKKWANTFREATLPNWIPTALVPIIEVMTGYSFFQGRRLTPLGEQYLLKQEQYGPTTTEAAKALSRALGDIWGGEAPLSPREIEALVRGYTGGLGMHGMAIASWLMPKEYVPPAKDISEYPVIKAVLSRPYQSAEGLNDFYERLEELEKKARTAQKFKEAGKPVPPSLQYDKAELSRLRKARDKLAELRKEKEKVYKSNLSPEEKKARLEWINLQSLNIAQKALGRPPVE